MKIKTITCHDVYNFGATLQAYALMKYLQDKGHEVEIIDYKPDYLSTRYNLWRIGPRWEGKSPFIRIAYLALKFPGRLAERLSPGKRAFDKFKKNNMRITKKQFKNNEELKQDPPFAEVYIAGSDQIWNTSYKNGRDPAFYLDFSPPGIRRVSYAASFSISEILPEYKSFVRTMIKKLDYISVREREGLDILKSIGIEAGVHVLDPVFLLDQSIWNTLADKKITDKYLLVYDFEQNEAVEAFVKKMAKEKGLKIFAVNNYKETPYADADYHDSGPEIFLSLIKNAEIVVGNSFHAVAFSLIFKKEFFVFGRIKQQVNSRMQDLLSLCDLNDRMISSEMDCQEKLDPISYGKTWEILRKNIDESKAFLGKAITFDWEPGVVDMQREKGI